MFGDDSEAGHLSEIYDDVWSGREPYTEKERAEYIRKRSNCFRRSDVGKYVIRASSRYNRGVMPFMYLVDRKLSSSMWWSPYSRLAVVFDKRNVAERVCSKLKHNRPSVVTITPDMAGRDVL